MNDKQINEKNVFKKANSTIVLLNGTSSSGKSTLSKFLQIFLEFGTEERYTIISIDDFLKMSPNETIYEEDVYEVTDEMMTAIESAANSNLNIIIDHVITSKRIFSKLANSLNNYDVYMVKVTAPLDELRRREKIRRARSIGTAEASLRYLYPTHTYDLVVDTFKYSEKECVQMIKKLLSNKPKAMSLSLNELDKSTL